MRCGLLSYRFIIRNGRWARIISFGVINEKRGSLRCGVVRCMC